MLKTLYLAIITFCLNIAFLSTCAKAQQLKFDKQSKNGDTHFSYRWKDDQDNVHELDFSYQNKVLYGHFRNFTGYQPKRAYHSVLNTLKKTAAKVDRKKVSINFVEHYDSVELKLAGRDEKLLDQVKTVLIKERERALQKFRYDHYYNVLTDKFGRSGLKPDHVRIAKESIKDFKSIRNALLKKYPNLNRRQMVSVVMSFIQNIPYSTLENRRTSSGAGFSPPLKLLNSNQGDCDSKVTLMASILRSMYPSMQMAIIYLPNHALLGVQVGGRKNEKSVKVSGRKLVLAEPTGPALLPLGQIAESSEFFINGQQFSYELF